MATTKPTKPSITLPSAFGTSASNVKTPFTSQELIDGYSASIQQILDGGNVNWLNDTMFKYLTYSTAICDWLNGISASKVPFINSSNQLDSATPVLESSNNTFTGNNTFNNTITGNISGSSGSCTGNAATATKATQDGSGNTITSTYMNQSASNANSTGKSTIVGWGMPDYSAGVSPSLVSDTKYTASTNLIINGFVSVVYNAAAQFYIYNSSDTQLQNFQFLMGNQNETRKIPFEFVIPKGYKYSVHFGGYSSFSNVKVFPLVGG